MSWYQRCDEMRALEGLLMPPHEDELSLDGSVLKTAPTGREVTTDEVGDWALQHFGTWDDLMAALQKNDPKALRSQYLHHRAKTAKKFADLEEFWKNPEAPRPARLPH